MFADEIQEKHIERDGQRMHYGFEHFVDLVDVVLQPHLCSKPALFQARSGLAFNVRITRKRLLLERLRKKLRQISGLHFTLRRLTVRVTNYKFKRNATLTSLQHAFRQKLRSR